MRTFALQSDHSAARRLPGVALLLTLTALAVYAVPSLLNRLQFERTDIAAGQWWRLLTCHFTHWSLDHLFWDLLVFAVLGVICERINRACMLACLALSSAAISIAVWWLAPELSHYRGLSGLDSAFFTLLVSMIARTAITEKRWGGLAMPVLMLVLFGAKVFYEAASGATIFADHTAGGFVPAPPASGRLIMKASKLKVVWT